MFVTTLKPELWKKLHQDLQNQGFEFSQPQYTKFSAKKKGLSCTLYDSGKLVIQGKESGPFIEFYIEPELLHSFEYTTSQISSATHTPHIGIDESGKGDFFGPLCVAGVYATNEQIAQLLDMGVRDSKKITDKTIATLSQKIKKTCLHSIVKINPTKYNEIYTQFKNLNRLLGWGHATAIEYLVTHSSCTQVTIDQFADESVVITALKRKQLTLELTQRHRGEEDPVVAAASILARDTFLEGLKQLGDQLGLILPKGGLSENIVKVGKQIYRKLGKEGLSQVAKLHFKTLDSILENG